MLDLVSLSVVPSACSNWSHESILTKVSCEIYLNRDDSYHPGPHPRQQMKWKKELQLNLHFFSKIVKLRFMKLHVVAVVTCISIRWVCLKSIDRSINLPRNIYVSCIVLQLTCINVSFVTNRQGIIYWEDLLLIRWLCQVERENVKRAAWRWT